MASSCAKRAYYLSPFPANSNAYYAKPSVSDSITSALYASGGLAIGYFNYDGTDKGYHGQFSIHHSITGPHVQAFYGANVALGVYEAKQINKDSTDYFYPRVINKRAGDLFYGGAWVNGGVNAVIPFANKHEWRVFGLQAAFGKEWGEYYEFRRDMPIEAVSSVYKDDRFGSIGINTEVVWTLDRGAHVGMKFAYGESFYRKIIDQSKSEPDYNYYLGNGYYSGTFHFTREFTTFYAQLNRAPYATTVQLGLTFRIAHSGKRY